MSTRPENNDLGILPWESFGDVLDAAAKVGRAGIALFNELEGGTIPARAQSPPPETGNPILDEAGVPSPEWWTAYEKANAEGLGAPLVWSRWLRSEVKIPKEDGIRILRSQFDIERERYDNQRVQGQQENAWSDLEALAWIASRDRELVAEVRSFAHQSPLSYRVDGRAVGLRYLQFQIATRHCCCDARHLLRPIGSEGACICLRDAWHQMLGHLQAGGHGQLRATLAGEGRTIRSVDCAEYLTAVFDTPIGSIHWTPIAAPGELLFLKTDVMACGSDGSLSANRRPSIGPRRFTDPERKQWIKQCSQSNGDVAFRAYKDEPSYDGTTQEAFRAEWKSLLGRKRGRPRKQGPVG